MLHVLHELHTALHLQTDEPDNPLLPTNKKRKNLLSKYSLYLSFNQMKHTQQEFILQIGLFRNDECYTNFIVFFALSTSTFYSNVYCQMHKSCLQISLHLEPFNRSLNFLCQLTIEFTADKMEYSPTGMIEQDLFSHAKQASGFSLLKIFTMHRKDLQISIILSKDSLLSRIKIFKQHANGFQLLLIWAIGLYPTTKIDSSKLEENAIQNNPSRIYSHQLVMYLSLKTDSVNVLIMIISL